MNARVVLRRALWLVVILALSLPSWAARAQDEPRLPPLPIDEIETGDEGETDTPGGESGEVVDVREATIPLDESSLPCQGCDLKDLFPCSQPNCFEPSPEVVSSIDGVLKSKHLKGANIGVLAIAYPEGVVLYERNSQDPFNPASVVKLFTAATALTWLGGGRTFETSAAVRETGECGELYLKGGGDPGLRARDLEELARKTREAGVECVSSLHMDLSLFDEVILPPHYDQKRTDAAYRSMVGALGIDDGVIGITVSPGKFHGATPVVKVEPTCSGFVVDNRALTVDVPGDDELDVRVREVDGQFVVVVTGEISTTHEPPLFFAKAVPRPDLLAFHLFLDGLKAAGVRVEDSAAHTATTPEDARLVASLRSDELREDLARMLLESKNFVAEQVLKLLGTIHCSPATFDCGLEAVRQALPLFHIAPACLRIENGSGLYDANDVSPAQLVRFMTEVANRPELFDQLYAFLPVGNKSGTLQKRMSKVRREVHAKTGTLNGVSTLAGYIDRKEGRLIVFAILFNRAKSSAYKLRRIQDEIVGILADWPMEKKKGKHK